MASSKYHRQPDHELPQAVPLPPSQQPSASPPAPILPAPSTDVPGRLADHGINASIVARPAEADSHATAATPSAVGSDSQAEEERESEAEFDDAATLVMEQSSPWLISMMVHMLMMIVMGLVVYVNRPQKPILLNAQMTYAEEKGEQLLLNAPGAMENDPSVTEVVLAPVDLPAVAEPLAAPRPSPEVLPEGTTAASNVEAPQFGLALRGREEGSATKKGLLGKYGGTDTTEAAVKRGLEWLAKNQRRDGSWSLAGPYSGGVLHDFDNRAAATAMALLAFQGAGNTHQDGKYKKNVIDAWRWLLKQQDESGCFFHEGAHNHRFYTQGQCAIAICELLGMTGDTMYREPAQRAIDYCLVSQGIEGGWRYAPNADSDVSVTGWVVMALQSARMAGLQVPKENLERISEYLDKVADAEYDGARYPYQRGGEVRLAMTAEALLMREYLGWKQNDSRLVTGVQWITAKENLINYEENHNVYYWYYATQAVRHLGGQYWTRWNNVMRQAIPEHQVARGREAGSWDPHKPTSDQWASQGGRLYVTCLSIYMLEVYYRHMPIYASVYAYDADPSATPEKADTARPDQVSTTPAEEEPDVKGDD